MNFVYEAKIRICDVGVDVVFRCVFWLENMIKCLWGDNEVEVKTIREERNGVKMYSQLTWFTNWFLVEQEKTKPVGDPPIPSSFHTSSVLKLE